MHLGRWHSRFSPGTHVKTLEETPAFWLLSGPALTVEAIWGMNLHIKDISPSFFAPLSLPLSLSLSLPSSIILSLSKKKKKSKEEVGTIGHSVYNVQMIPAKRIKKIKPW